MRESPVISRSRCGFVGLITDQMAISVLCMSRRLVFILMWNFLEGCMSILCSLLYTCNNMSILCNNMMLPSGMHPVTLHSFREVFFARCFGACYIWCPAECRIFLHVHTYIVSVSWVDVIVRTSDAFVFVSKQRA